MTMKLVAWSGHFGSRLTCHQHHVAFSFECGLVRGQPTCFRVNQPPCRCQPSATFELITAFRTSCGRRLHRWLGTLEKILDFWQSYQPMSSLLPSSGRGWTKTLHCRQFRLPMWALFTALRGAYNIQKEGEIGMHGQTHRPSPISPWTCRR